MKNFPSLKTAILILSFTLTQLASAFEIDKDELLKRAPGLTSKGAQKRLLRANTYMSKDDRKSAIAILEKMTKKSYRAFEQAKVWQTLAYAYAQIEKYKKARNAFEMTLKQNALPYKPTLQSLFALAQLEVLAEDYSKAEKNLNLWFKLSNEPNADAHAFMATIAHHKNQKKKALEQILKAIELTKKPKENWLVFAVSILYEQSRYKEASEMLYKLIDTNHTKKMYWSQLAGSLLNSEKSMSALSTLTLAMKLELLTEEPEILNIASLYLSNRMPYEASLFLEEGFSKKLITENKKNLELYSTSLIQAKELDKALVPLARAAALSKDGKLYALEARLYLEKEEFKTAVKYFDQAISKGLKKKQKGQVLIEKAVALIQLKDFPKADSALDQAQKIPTASKMAANWKNYIRNL